MIEAARSALQRVSQSLFFIPVVVVALCVVLALVTTSLDDRVEELDSAPLLLSVSVSGGRSIASAVAGATITVAAIVFSITALISQLAATQYSPRAVAGFFEDRFQQLVIGLVVGTFAYALLVLASFGGQSEVVRPSVSATTVVFLGIASVVGIVGYLDHSLRRMRISAVVRRIAEDTARAVRRTRVRSGSGEALSERPTSGGEPRRIHTNRTGWVHSIDATEIAHDLPAEFTARIEVRVGEAVFDGDVLATVWPPRDGDERDTTPLRRSIHVGRDRSLAGDPSYGIRQLVDIGLRALSPGVNDPTTAVDVIHHLKLPLREILRLEQPARVFGGPDGQRVFLAEAPSRSDIVHSAFSEMRLAAAEQPEVLKTLLEVQSDLIGELRAADLDGRTAALVEEARLAVASATKAGFPDVDLERVLRAAPEFPSNHVHAEDRSEDP